MIDDKRRDKVFRLYDKYCHGDMSRRDFLDRLTVLAGGAAGAAILAKLVMPNYASAEQIAPDDSRITTMLVKYASPKGAGEMEGLLAAPRNKAPVGGVVVVHENRGRNPYIADVARRVAVAGYVAFAPDALYPLGGYPGNDDDGRTLQSQRDRAEMLEDFIAAAEFLKTREECDGRVACIGFCFGGWVTNMMAVKMDELAGAVPFYGGWPTANDAAAVSCPLQIHLGELDERVNAGWPDYRAALKANNKEFEAFMYEGAQHGFHNDSTGRYKSDAAELAWSRVLEFFGRTIG